MKLKILGVRETGNLDKERIVMTVASPGDLGEFLLMQTGFSGDSVTTTVYETLWFPDKLVNVGDFVVVYTKRGTPSDRPFKGVTSHFYYWGLDEAVWNKPGRAGVVMHAPVWESFRAE